MTSNDILSSNYSHCHDRHIKLTPPKLARGVVELITNQMAQLRSNYYRNHTALTYDTFTFYNTSTTRTYNYTYSYLLNGLIVCACTDKAM